ncbi:hypothetical protein FB451DRAFT_1406727 [Mycena latifolia]|nr:hypothetical protein FB451DRAFT_1406727 [Mycena latifolia]
MVAADELHSVGIAKLERARLQPRHGAPAPSTAPAIDPLYVCGVHEQHHHTLFPPTNTLQPNLGLVAVLVHLLGDAINNVGVIVAEIFIWKLRSPSRFYADPAVSLGISLIIFASAILMSVFSLCHAPPVAINKYLSDQAGRILLEAAPVELDLDKVKEDLLALPDVLAVHNLHVWILSQSCA